MANKLFLYGGLALGGYLVYKHFNTNSQAGMELATVQKWYATWQNPCPAVTQMINNKIPAEIHLVYLMVTQYWSGVNQDPNLQAQWMRLGQKYGGAPCW